MIQKILAAAFAITVFSIAAECADAQTGQGNLPNSLFSQYLTQGGASQATAGMYPAPHPVPSHVGASWYTYQPLMPHEMMYTHSRNYYNYYNDSAFYGGGGSLNKTTVRWQNGSAGVAPLPLSNYRLQQARYALAAKRYCIDGNCGGGSYGGGFGGHGGLRSHLGGRRASRVASSGCTTCGE